MVRLIALLPFVAAVIAEVGAPTGESVDAMMEYTYDIADGNAQLNQPPAPGQAPRPLTAGSNTVYTDDVATPEYANPELAPTIQAPPQPEQPAQAARPASPQQAQRASPQQPVQQQEGPNSVQIISSAQAQGIIAAAIQKAIDTKAPSNIAVVDPYGHLVAFARMDGAPLVSIDVALKKAKTVSMFGGRIRSGDLMNATSPGGPLYGIERTNSGLLFFGGGVPIKTTGGVFVGSLGVSGGTADQDVQIANAAAASLK
jgi:uncharacterized protein GlcG (DUF336 family)